MSWAPRQMPSVGAPARSRRSISAISSAEKGIERLVVDADRAAEHDEQVGRITLDGAEVIHAGFEVAHRNSARGEDRGEDAQVLEGDVADNRGRAQWHPQPGSPQPPFSPFLPSVAWAALSGCT